VWVRDLKVDLTRLRDHFRVTTIVSLLSEAELRTLKVRGYHTAVLSHGLQLVSLPMVEMAAPGNFDDACALVSDLRRRVEEGEVLAAGPCDCFHSTPLLLVHPSKPPAYIPSHYSTSVTPYPTAPCVKCSRAVLQSLREMNTV